MSHEKKQPTYLAMLHLPHRLLFIPPRIMEILEIRLIKARIMSGDLLGRGNINVSSSASHVLGSQG